MSGITPAEACLVIAKCDPKEVVATAERLGIDKETIALYKAYVPNWRATAETRGALVTMLKFIASEAISNPNMEVSCEKCGETIRLGDVPQHFIDKHGWKIVHYGPQPNKDLNHG